MQVKVIMRTTYGQASYPCNDDDTVSSVCEKYLRFKGHPIEKHPCSGARIGVNGEDYETASHKKLRDVQLNRKVFICLIFKAGEIWQVDDDGVYRYKGEYI